MTPLITTFSRPEISGWKPAPSSMSAETLPVTSSVPRRRLEEARDELQERRLAAAVRPDDAERLAPRDRERDVRERGDDLRGRERRREAAPEEGGLQRAERARPSPLAVELREAPRGDGRPARVTRPPGRSRAAGRRRRIRGETRRGRSGRGRPTSPARSTRPQKNASCHASKKGVAGFHEERRAEAFGPDVRQGVEDGRREEPEREARREDVLHVAEVDRQRREEEADPATKTPSRRKSGAAWTSGQPSGTGGTEAPAAPSARPAPRTGSARRKWTPCAATATSGRTSAGNRIFLRSAPCVRSDDAASVSAPASQFHGRRPHEEEQGVRARRGAPRREDEREDERVDRRASGAGSGATRRTRGRFRGSGPSAPARRGRRRAPGGARGRRGSSARAVHPGTAR